MYGVENKTHPIKIKMKNNIEILAHNAIGYLRETNYKTQARRYQHLNKIKPSLYNSVEELEQTFMDNIYSHIQKFREHDFKTIGKLEQEIQREVVSFKLNDGYFKLVA